MNQSQNENREFDSSNLLFFMFKWRKQLIVVTFAAALISAGVSFLLEERFLATTIFFPAENSSLSKAVMTEDAAAKNDISAFGEQEKAEAMIQILKSDEIKWRIWGKYNLMEHYGIDPKEQFANTKLSKKWENRVSYKRTEFNSIRVDVLDTDPNMAADIANDIAALVDTVKNQMLRDRAREALKVVEKEYFGLLEYMNELDDSLTLLRNKGVHDHEKQIESLTKVYYESVANNNRRAMEELGAALDTLAKYGSAHISMTENLEFLRERYVMLKGKYEEVRVDATQSGTHKFMVNKATPAEKREYPVRSLIVLVSTLATFLLAILVIIGVENFKKFAQQLPQGTKQD